MNKKIPIEIRRYFSTRTYPKNWKLLCDHDGCDYQLQVEKPTKGKDIDSTTLLSLLNHLHSHDIEQDYKQYTVVKVMHGVHIGDTVSADVGAALPTEGEVFHQGDTYMVVVKAANRHHAEVIGQGLINKLTQDNKLHRQTWRDRFFPKE